MEVSGCHFSTKSGEKASNHPFFNVIMKEEPLASWVFSQGGNLVWWPFALTTDF